MKTKQIVTAVFCAMIASASVPSLAADNSVRPNGSSTTAQKEGGTAPMQDGTMGGGMMNQEPGTSGTNMNQNHASRAKMGSGQMGGGMMGGGMMGGGMMNHGTMGNRMLMPQLPAGNEKLQLQMQAEIMQKVGEIIGKYADKVVINKGEAQ